MWFKGYDRYSCKIEKFVHREINERNIGQDGQRFSCSRLCVLTRCGQCVTEKYFIVLFQMQCFIPEYMICSRKYTLPSGIRNGPYWMTINPLSVDINVYIVGIFMYNYMTQKLPKFFENYFQRNRDVHDLNTRQANDFMYHSADLKHEDSVLGYMDLKCGIHSQHA